MGSTVTTGKFVAAFAVSNNEIGYVLFEESYEKNCYPHKPHWSCCLIGSKEDAIRAIFNWGAACEGGMLQSRSGWIKPESYIADWLKELAAPYEMPDVAVTLRVGDGWSAPVPKEGLDKIAAALEAIGRGDVATQLRAGVAVPLSLHADARVITALYGKRELAPWRVIGSEWACIRTQSRRNDGMGYKPVQTVKYDVAKPVALKVDRDVRLLQRDDGTWYSAGWQYAIVSKFIQDQGEVELNEPGTYRKRIAAFREALDTASPMPEGTKVAVNMVAASADPDYQPRWMEQVMKNVAITRTEFGFEFVPTTDTLYEASAMGPVHATWILPGSAAIASKAA